MCGREGKIGDRGRLESSGSGHGWSAGNSSDYPSGWSLRVADLGEFRVDEWGCAVGETLCVSPSAIVLLRTIC